MYYIYEKNLVTDKSKFVMEVGDKKVAEFKVREMNSVSLFEDKYYYIEEKKS